MVEYILFHNLSSSSLGLFTYMYNDNSGEWFKAITMKYLNTLKWNVFGES